MMSSHVSHAVVLPNAVVLPKCWTRHVRSALLQAISLAATAWTVARSRAATSRRRERLQADLDRAVTDQGGWAKPRRALRSPFPASLGPAPH
jgi:hypothetical protein